MCVSYAISNHSREFTYSLEYTCTNKLDTVKVIHGLCGGGGGGDSIFTVIKYTIHSHSTHIWESILHFIKRLNQRQTKRYIIRDIFPGNYPVVGDNSETGISDHIDDRITQFGSHPTHTISKVAYTRPKQSVRSLTFLLICIWLS
jgi:hypothetical protein